MGHPDSDCQFNITVRDRRAIGEFSWQQAKTLAQDVVEHCEEEGLHFGGWASLPPDREGGWKVEITGKAPRESDEKWVGGGDLTEIRGEPAAAAAATSPVVAVENAAFG